MLAEDAGVDFPAYRTGIGKVGPGCRIVAAAMGGLKRD